MKNVLLIVIVICINSCRMPADPLGEIKIIKRLDTIDTGGNCLDLDVDIIDNVLVAAANYNGYFIYKINSINGIVSDISEQKHVGANEMDNSLGDNRAQSVILSKEHNIAFVMDQYDHIWLYKYEEGATQYGTPNHLKELCYGGTWLSIAIDDQSDKIGIYTLLKHNAAQLMPYCIDVSNLGNLGTDQGCSDIEEYIATEYNDQTSCEAEEGYTWMYPGCQVGNRAICEMPGRLRGSRPTCLHRVQAFRRSSIEFPAFLFGCSGFSTGRMPSIVTQPRACVNCSTARNLHLIRRRALRSVDQPATGPRASMYRPENDNRSRRSCAGYGA